jgi:hypothetical protein
MSRGVLDIVEELFLGETLRWKAMVEDRASIEVEDLC